MTRQEVTTEVGSFAHDSTFPMDRQSNPRQSSDVERRQSNGSSNGYSNFLRKDTTLNSQNLQPALSTIAIMRRHTMYDSLMLVKRYKASLKGYSLEFPTSDSATNISSKDQQKPHEQTGNDCQKTRLISVFLDGDDPIYQSQEKSNGENGLKQLPVSEGGEIVYVPMNGLIDRLDNYDRHGVFVDGKVYAFAMGLKMAERFMRTSSMKEIQETPPL